MFKLNRRTFATLTALAAVAGGTVAATPAVAATDITIGTVPDSHLGPTVPKKYTAPPTVGDAAVCKKWVIPSHFWFEQTDGLRVETQSRRSAYSWSVAGSGAGTRIGTLKLTRFDRSGHNAQVRFTITWGSHNAGIYTGVIDDDGFLTGSMRGRYNANSKADFEFADTIDCARY